MRKKFKIMYPRDYHELDKRGKPYHAPAHCLVVMTNGGVFLLMNKESGTIRKLSEVLYKYDVVWK